MNTRIGFSAAAVLSLVAAACGASQTSRPADDPAAPATRPGVVVLDATAQERAGIVIAPVRTITAAERITAPGLIALDETRTARVGSLQEGLVLDIRADVGRRVRAQQLLATMHGHAVHDAWAGYRKAVADRRKLQKELAYATETRGRAQRLYATKSISLQEQQRAEVDEVAAEEQLAMAEAELVRAIEELEHIGIAHRAAGPVASRTARRERTTLHPASPSMGCRHRSVRATGWKTTPDPVKYEV